MLFRLLWVSRGQLRISLGIIMHTVANSVAIVHAAAATPHASDNKTHMQQSRMQQSRMQQ